MRLRKVLGILFGRVYSAVGFFRGIMIADVILPRDGI